MFTLAGCFVVISLYTQNVKSFHDNGWNNVGRFSRFEVGIKLPINLDEKVESFLQGGEGINPYDFSRIIVKAEFAHGSDLFKREGFYYREISINENSTAFVQSKSEFPFRIRFAPPYNGNYTFQITLTVDSILLATYNGTFTVIESGLKGFLSVGQYSHLIDFHKKPFFAIGQNIAYAQYEPIEPNDFVTQRNYISDLANNSGNIFRIRMDPWSNEIEREELGVYGSARQPKENYERQWHAYELDETFELAENRGVYMFITLLGDYDFKKNGTGTYGWNQNPYRNIEVSHLDFFDIKRGHSLNSYKNKLRYFMARYGYCANIAVVSLINETDQLEEYKVNSKLRANISIWVNEIGSYLKSSQFYPTHLLTNGYSSRPISPDRGIEDSKYFDIITKNQYSNSRRVIKDRHDDLVKFLKGSKKPFVFGEIGAGICSSPGMGHEDWYSDAEFHNSIWSTSMNSRSFGNGLYWWDWEQENHTDQRLESAGGLKHRLNFRALAKFFVNSPIHFDLEEFRSTWDYDVSSSRRIRKRKVEWIANVNKAGTIGFGWVHNSDYYWINDPKGIINSNCSTCENSGLVAFYSSECYSEDKNVVSSLNEPKGPYPYSMRKVEIVLEGYLSNMNYQMEIWSCYDEGGLVESFEVKSDGKGRIKFRKSLGVCPGDQESGPPDFAFKINLPGKLGGN